jgi:hypothetical protein
VATVAAALGQHQKRRHFEEFSGSRHQRAPSHSQPYVRPDGGVDPQPIDLIFRTNNLRKLANDVNRKLTKWFRDEWARDVNIVATDYFLGNDIINVAIEANVNR